MKLYQYPADAAHFPNEFICEPCLEYGRKTFRPEPGCWNPTDPMPAEVQPAGPVGCLICEGRFHPDGRVEKL